MGWCLVGLVVAVVVVVVVECCCILIYIIVEGVGALPVQSSSLISFSKRTCRLNPMSRANREAVGGPFWLLGALVLI